MGVLYEKDGKIAIITINRPEAMNAMNLETHQALGDALRDIDEDEGIWVGIITGAGEKAFSAGADLKTMHRGEHTGPFFQPWRPHRYDAGMPVSKPLIAAVNGYCLAGGFELAEFCDIRIASENASFGCPEVRWNILHGYGALRLPQMIPMSLAMEMLLAGDRIDAQEAYRIGLVSKVVPLPELMPTAIQLAKRICENGPIAVRMTKELAYLGLDSPIEDGLRLYQSFRRIIDQSEDAKEGPRAFTEKRSPVFKGR